MNVENDKIVLKIKKLLALSESDNVNEAASAARMASKMMAEYQISMSEVIKMEIKQGEALTDDPISDQIYSSWPVWMQTLAINVAKLFECEATFKTSFCGGKMLVVQGYEADTMMVRWLYDYLYKSLKKMADEAAKTRNDRSVHGTTYRKSFLAGAVCELRCRIRQIIIEREVLYKSNDTDLMIVKKDAIEEKYGVVKYASSKRSHGNKEALEKGRKVGLSINLNRPLGAKSANKALK